MENEIRGAGPLTALRFLRGSDGADTPRAGQIPPLSSNPYLNPA